MILATAPANRAASVWMSKTTSSSPCAPNPNVCVVVNADDGKVLATLPIGNGTDGGGFNPNTMEAWSSQRDGTLTIIKESSPTSFAVEQTVQTKPGCKTSSLDTKNNRIVLICTERLPQAAAATAPAPDERTRPPVERRGGRARRSRQSRRAVGWPLISHFLANSARPVMVGLFFLPETEGCRPANFIIAADRFGLIRFPELITSEGSGGGKPVCPSW